MLSEVVDDDVDDGGSTGDDSNGDFSASCWASPEGDVDWGIVVDEGPADVSTIFCSDDNGDKCKCWLATITVGDMLDCG